MTFKVQSLASVTPLGLLLRTRQWALTIPERHMAPGTHPTCFLSSLYVYNFCFFRSSWEYVFPSTNSIFSMKTSEHARPSKTFFLLNNGLCARKKRCASCHPLYYCFVLSFTSCLVISFSMCVHMSHFPNYSVKPLRAKTSLMFLWIPHSAWHHAIPAAWHSIGWSAAEAALNALVRTERNINLPHD